MHQYDAKLAQNCIIFEEASRLQIVADKRIIQWSCFQIQCYPSQMSEFICTNVWDFVPRVALACMASNWFSNNSIYTETQYIYILPRLASRVSLISKYFENILSITHKCIYPRQTWNSAWAWESSLWKIVFRLWKENWEANFQEANFLQDFYKNALFRVLYIPFFFS